MKGPGKARAVPSSCLQQPRSGWLWKSPREPRPCQAHGRKPTASSRPHSAPLPLPSLAGEVMCISYSQPVLDQLSCLHLNGCKGSHQPQGLGRPGCWTPAKTMMDFTLLPFMLGKMLHICSG